jgi:exonuclease SbcC
MIYKLALKNFRQHVDTEIDFKSGLNSLSGDNGAGKSGVLKAIMYCLFGSAATASKKENLTTWGSTEKMECQLYCSIGGKFTHIIRGLEKAAIYVADELVASGHTPCTRWVEQELGLDAKAFKHLLYAPQGETQALLKLGASDLQRKIELITKVDGIDKIVKLVSEDLSVLAGKLSVLPPVEDIQGLELTVSLSRADEDALTTSIRSKESMYEENQKTLADRRKFAMEMAAELKVTQRAFAEREALTAELGRVSEDFRVIEASQPARTVPQLNLEIEAIKLDLTKKQRAIQTSGDNSKYVSRANKKHEDAVISISNLKDNKIGINHRLGLVRLVEDSETNVHKTNKDLKAASEQKTHCPACERKYDDVNTEAFQARVAKLKADYLLAIQDNRAASLSLSAFDASSSNAFVGFKDYDELENKLGQDVARTLQTLVSANAEFEILSDAELIYLTSVVHNDKLDLEIKSRDLITALAWDQDCVVIIKQKARILSRLGDIESVTCGWTEEELVALEQEIDVMQVKAQADYVLLMAEKFKLKEAESHSLACAKQLLESKQNAEARKKTESEQADRKELSLFLRNNRARLMTGTWDTITSLTSAYASDITSGLLSNLIRDDAGDFLVTEGYITVPVSELSGGRQSIIGLALRVALVQTFYGEHGFILLDEVASDLTEENSAAVAGFLAGLNTQVVSVTHRQGEAVNATNIILL